MNLLSYIAILAYLTATASLAFRFYHAAELSDKTRLFSNLAGIIALCVHANILYSSIVLGHALDFGFFNAVSLIAWLVALIVTVTALFRPIDNLLLILYPAAIFALLLEVFLPGHHLLTASLSGGLRIHILLSICAYSLLSISALQALLLSMQEHMIKTKRATSIIHILPPLQVMEDLLIQLILVGFFLLSLSLASGAMFIDDLFAQHLAHKTVLSILAWLIYFILLCGRWSAGWRGKVIIRWTLGGFIVLLLAYFGSKFVLELVLNRV